MKLEFLKSVELSDLGKKRKNNEDSCLRMEDQGIFCVADGMGGEFGGDLASEAITTSVQEAFNKFPLPESASLTERIGCFEKAVNQASKWIKNFADEKLATGMGSTVVALIFSPRNATKAVGLHAGDSRLYRYRNGELKLLTQDHTAAAVLAAKLDRIQSSLPTQFQNQLTRAVGISERTDLERTLVEVCSWDLFLLCSDGLPRMVPDEGIARILKQQSQTTCEQTARTLVDEANQAGGNDNVTVVLVKVGDISGLAKVDESADELESITLSSLATTVTEPSVPSTELPHDHTITPETGEILRGYTPEDRESSNEQTTPAGQPRDRTVVRSPVCSVVTTIFAAFTWKWIAYIAAALAIAGTGIWLHSVFQVDQVPSEVLSAPPITNSDEQIVGGAPGPHPDPLVSSVDTNTKVRADATTGDLATNTDITTDTIKLWTNSLDMVFVKFPGKQLWVSTTRVTPGQFERITERTLNDNQKGLDDGQPCLVNISYEDVKILVVNLKNAGETPPDCDSCQIAIPTIQQWRNIADSGADLGVTMSNLTRFAEWCVNASELGQLAFGRILEDRNPRGKYETGNLSNPLPDGQPVPETALRLILAP